MAKTQFRLIAEAVNEALAAILTAENRAVPDFVYSRQAFTGADKDFRVGWTQPHGSYVAKPAPPTGDPPIDGDTAAPPVPPIILRRPMAYIRIAAPDAEICEHIGDRLVLATKRSAYSGNFTWTLATFQYPVEIADQQQMRNGVELLVVMVPIDLPVAAEFDGERVTVAIADTQLRAGLSDVLDTTTVGQPQFQLSEWA